MIKAFILVLIFSASQLFSQQVYNYIGRSSSKLSIPYNAQISKNGNETYYAWYNDRGFFFFTSRNGIIVTARRDLLVASKDQAYRMWAALCEEIMRDGFYPYKTDIGDATFKDAEGIFAEVWIEWNEEQLMYAVTARYE